MVYSASYVTPIYSAGIYFAKREKITFANFTTFHCVVLLVFQFPFARSRTLELWSYLCAQKIGFYGGLCSTSGFTFADVAGDAADLPVDHLLVKLFDVKGLYGEGEVSCQHGKHAHASAHTSGTKTTFTLQACTENTSV